MSGKIKIKTASYAASRILKLHLSSDTLTLLEFVMLVLEYVTGIGNRRSGKEGAVHKWWCHFQKKCLTRLSYYVTDSHTSSCNVTCHAILQKYIHAYSSRRNTLWIVCLEFYFWTLTTVHLWHLECFVYICTYFIWNKVLAWYGTV